MATLSTEARSYLLISAWSQAFHLARLDTAADTSCDVLWINGFVYKYWAAEKQNGCPESLWREALRSLPRPDFVFNLDLPPQLAAVRKLAFSPFECGFAETCTADAFCKFQQQIGIHLHEILQENFNSFVPVDANADAKATASLLHGKLSKLL